MDLHTGLLPVCVGSSGFVAATTSLARRFGRLSMQIHGAMTMHTLIVRATFGNRGGKATVRSFRAPEDTEGGTAGLPKCMTTSLLPAHVVEMEGLRQHVSSRATFLSNAYGIRNRDLTASI